MELGYEKRNTGHLKLDVETNDNIVNKKEDVDELRHQRQHNVIDPQHEKLVEEVVEVVRSFPRSISEYNAVVQL